MHIPRSWITIHMLAVHSANSDGHLLTARHHSRLSLSLGRVIGRQEIGEVLPRESKGCRDTEGCSLYYSNTLTGLLPLNPLEILCTSSMCLWCSHATTLQPLLLLVAAPVDTSMRAHTHLVMTLSLKHPPSFSLLYAGLPPRLS